MGSDGSQRDEVGTTAERAVTTAGGGFVARVLANMSLGLELQRAHRTQLQHV